MKPYIAMADQRGTRLAMFRNKLRKKLRLQSYIVKAKQTPTLNEGAVPWKCVAGSFFPWQDLLTTPWSTTTFLSLFCLAVASFVVSLKVALLATQHVGERWTLTVRPGPAKALIGGYALMATYTAMIGVVLFG